MDEAAPAGGAVPGHGSPAGSRSGSEALARATLALQEESEPGWSDVADRVTDRLRGVSRPGRPLLVREDDAGVVRVDQRVVVDATRRALAEVPACRPVGVTVHTEAGVATSVRVQVWAGYGVDVRQVAAAVRAATVSVLTDVLGVTLPVDVDVVDVEVTRPYRGDRARVPW